MNRSHVIVPIYWCLLTLIVLSAGFGCLPAVETQRELPAITQPDLPDIEIAPRPLSCPEVILDPSSIRIAFEREWTIKNMTTRVVPISEASIQERIPASIKYILINKTDRPLSFTVKIRHTNRELDSKAIVIQGNTSQEITHSVYFHKSDCFSDQFNPIYKNLTIFIPIRCPYPHLNINNIIFSACMAIWIEPT